MVASWLPGQDEPLILLTNLVVETLDQAHSVLRFNEKGSIRIWDICQRKVLETIICDPNTKPCTFLAQGRKLLTLNREADSYDLWDLMTRESVQTWKGAAKAPPMTVTSDLGWVLTLRGGSAPSILSNLEDGQETPVHLDISDSFGFSFSPNGKLLAASSIEGYVRLWEMTTWVEVITFEDFLLGVFDVGFSPDGQRLVANIYLQQFSLEIADGAHAVLVWDQAGYNKSRGLKVPEKVTIIPLPAYSQELNPVDNLRHYFRSHYRANRAYAERNN